MEASPMNGAEDQFVLRPNPVLLASQEDASITKEKADARFEDDARIVDFDDQDPEDPHNWPLWRKWSIVILVATMFMLVYVQCAIA